jgi:hypothetical protein
MEVRDGGSIMRRVRQKGYVTYHQLLEPERRRVWITPGTFVRKKLGLSIARLKRRLRLRDVDADGSARMVGSGLIPAGAGGTLGGRRRGDTRRTRGMERRVDRPRSALLPPATLADA